MTIQMEKEIRSIDPVDAEVRATRRGRTVTGRAIVFNKESRDLGGFTEIIHPEAMDGIIEKADILALLNHNLDRGVLARSTNGKGTLTLTIDAMGVNYEFDAPDTPLGDEVLSGIRRNDIRTSSFGFAPLPNNAEFQKWEKRSDGSYLRHVKKFVDIVDVSPVWREAYIDTTAAVRSLVDEKTSEADKKIADLEEELRKKPPSDSTNADMPKMSKKDEAKKMMEDGKAMMEKGQKMMDAAKKMMGESKSLPIPEKDLRNYFKEIDERIKKM
jgi:HK97 family phage prohead protease